MNSYKNRSVARDVQLTFLMSGLILLLFSVLYNELLWTLFSPDHSLRETTTETIRSVQICFLVTGLGLICISELVRRIPLLKNTVRKEFYANILLLFMTVFLPISIIELSLRPFFNLNRKTTIFEKDPDLGWRLRPNSNGIWGGVRVKINGKGLRGPELTHSKPPDVLRILYLGDSVTFGYTLDSYTETFPYVVEDRLEKTLSTEIQTINAGVGGYSTWQEYAYLSKQGIRYSPDLVVVSFVLNDVTEQLGLKKFGGSGEGYQLSRTAFTLSDWLLNQSSIYHVARNISARIRFGADIQKAAILKETLYVRSLINPPDSPDIKRAWEITLNNLKRTFDFCEDRDIRVVMVIFPYAVQFENAGEEAIPQQILNQFAIENGIPVIDLLPILSADMKRSKMKPEDYFVDDNHLSSFGSQVVGEIITDFIQSNTLSRP